MAIRKSVRFANDDKLCQFQEGPKELNQEMILEMWFQPMDFIHFRISAKKSCDMATKKGLSSYLKRTYGFADDRTQMLFNMWAKCQDTRRGLERFICEEYKQQRLYSQRKTVQAVLYTQDRLRKEDEHQSSERSSAVIANISSSLSHHAAQYARMMGVADHSAVTQFRVTANTRRPTSERVGKLSSISPLRQSRSLSKAIMLSPSKQRTPMHGLGSLVQSALITHDSLLAQ